MPPLSIRRVEDLKWEYGANDASDIPADQRSCRCFHHHGSENAPQLFEVKLRPNQTVPPHAHEHNEIIYILNGEMRLGTSVLSAGSSISVRGETVYGFSAGREGVHSSILDPAWKSAL
jgi:quercetin dioxygenase-like cupin family protein